MCAAINPEHRLIASFRNASQGHVFRWWNEIGPQGRAKLLAQLRSVDPGQLVSLAANVKAGRLTPHTPGEPEPASYIPLPRTAEEQRERQAARQAGEELIRAGKVAVLMAAGGAATRLRFDAPKGTYPIGPVSGRTLFQIHADRILATRRRYDASLPWYIVTSDATDAPTRAYFQEEDYFGLPREDVRVFRQRTMPALDHNFRLAMAAKDELLLSPNGNGGSLLALRETGMLDDMAARGVEEISYIQVDNPLVPAADPVFLGFHHLAAAQMSCKALRKRDPEEPVGALVKIGGRIVVVEYSDLTKAQKYQERPDGTLFYGLGSPAIHAMSVAFVRAETEGGFKLPFHLARKSAPYLDEAGKLVQPEEKNLYKFEFFIFDAMQDAERIVILEIRREEEFSPVKQPTGPDSVETSRGDMTALYASWLEQAGIQVPRDPSGQPVHPIEISPLYALDADELAARVPKDLRVDRPLYLGPEEG